MAEFFTQPPYTRLIESLPPTTIEQEEQTLLNASIAEAAKVLPRQPILENFVYQNPLGHFDELTFHAAIDYVHELEQFLSPAEQFKHLSSVDPRPRVDDALCELAATFLDRGAARWAVDGRERGFVFVFARLELLGSTTWRDGAREIARHILSECEGVSSQHESLQTLGHRCLLWILDALRVPRHNWTASLRASLLELRGCKSNASDRTPRPSRSAHAGEAH
jgi:hypothetical protein